MSHDLKKLANGYRRLTASPDLVSRIEAHIEAHEKSAAEARRSTRGRSLSGWQWPALSAGALAAVVVMIVMTTTESPTPVVNTPVVAHNLPGFSQLARTSVSSASMMTPSFSNLRSVSSPALPDKPRNPVYE